MNPAHSAVLSSWKEIAAYLGKGVRTVQRWERELALPVRRPIAHNKRIVIAVPDELDNWLRRNLAPAGYSWRGEVAARRAEVERMHRLLVHMHEETKKVRARADHLMELLKIATTNRGSRAEAAPSSRVGGDPSERNPDEPSAGRARRK